MSNKLNSKFNTGDNIFFMSGNEPKSAKVKGVMVILGEYHNLSLLEI